MSPFSRVDRIQVEMATRDAARRRRAVADLLACSMMSGQGYQAPQVKRPTEEEYQPPCLADLREADAKHAAADLAATRSFCRRLGSRDRLDPADRIKKPAAKGLTSAERSRRTAAASLAAIKGLVLKAIAIGPCDIPTIQMRVSNMDRTARAPRCREAARVLVGEGKVRVDLRHTTASSGAIMTFTLVQP